jgi:hypothetical protein
MAAPSVASPRFGGPRLALAFQFFTHAGSRISDLDSLQSLAGDSEVQLIPSRWLSTSSQPNSLSSMYEDTARNVAFDVFDVMEY